MSEQFSDVVENLRKINDIDELERICNQKINNGEELKISYRGLEYAYKVRGQPEKEKKVLKKLLNFENKKSDLWIRLSELTELSVDEYVQAIDDLITEKKETESSEFLEFLISEQWFDKLKVIKWCRRWGDNGKPKLGSWWAQKFIEVNKPKDNWQIVQELSLLAWELYPDEEVRKSLIESLKKLYKKSSHLDYFLEDLNIYNRRDLINGFNRLKRLLQYDQGCYVYHDSWGVGKIYEFNPHLNEVDVNFINKKHHLISMDKVEKILQPLSPDHWFVQIRENLDELREKIYSQGGQVVKMYLSSFPNPQYGTDIKINISKDLNIDESWWSKARNELKKDPYVDVSSGGKGGKFSLRLTPRTNEDKILSDLKASKDLEKHFEIIYDLINHQKSLLNKPDVATTVSKILKKNIELVKNYKLTKSNAVTRLWLKIRYGYLLSDWMEITGENNFSQDQVNLSVNNLLIEKNHQLIVELVENIKRHELRIRLVKDLKEMNWFDQDIHNLLLLSNTSGFRDYLSGKDINLDVSYIVSIQPFDSPEAMLWAIDKLVNKKVDIQDDLSEVAMVEWLFKLILQSSRTNSDQSKRVISKARDILKKDNYKLIENAVVNAALAQAKLILTWIAEYEAFSSVQKSELRTRLIRLKPELVVSDKQTKSISDRIFVSSQSFIQKQKKRDNLMNFQLPKIVKEIQRAAAMGDLSENFEYASARSKHREITNKISQLDQELSTARVIEKENLNTGQVGIGTTVKIKNHNQELSLSILGPWDSNPDNHIISYMSPLGQNMLGKQVGDKIIYHDREYEIVKIEVCTEL
ncbi:MAG: GreA/GreB family elongation factor [bacterium]